MKKILLLQNDRFLDSQVVKPVDYLGIINDWKVQRGGNSGNKLFTTAMEKYLYQPDIQLAHMDSQYKPEDINERFDMVVFPTANIFGSHYVSGLKAYAEFFEKLSIPVYVIGAGVQCRNYKGIQELIKIIGKEVGRFVNAVYHTGGEIALRGYFTKEFLDKIQRNTAAVTGCPSLYQNGSDICIPNKKVDFSEFRAAINGSVESINATNLCRVLRHATYMDQDEFCALLFDNNFVHTISDFKLLWKYSKYGLELVANQNVQLIYDVPVWIDFLRQNIDFSVGTRIHGNIAALLAGVPAMVIARDSRTRELAEYFEIPMKDNVGMNDWKTLYKIYESLDYTRFNADFKKKFYDFENFLKRHGIVDSIGNNVQWELRQKQYEWKQPMYSQENIRYIQKMLRKYPTIVKSLFSGRVYSKLKHLRKYRMVFTNLIK